jgi:hypothetical protein
MAFSSALAAAPAGLPKRTEKAVENIFKKPLTKNQI